MVGALPKDKTFTLTDFGRKYADIMWQIADMQMKEEKTMTLTERIEKKAPVAPDENAEKNIKLELKEIRVH